MVERENQKTKYTPLVVYVAVCLAARNSAAATRYLHLTQNKYAIRLNAKQSSQHSSQTVI